MTEVDNKLIMNTLKQVQEALNRRFEKDIDLYISPQEVQKIKNLLSNNKLQGIFGMYKTKKHSPDILTKVILDNAWLLDNPTKNDLRSYLKYIFNECDWELFSEYMTEIINNRKQLPLKLKKILVNLYYKRADVGHCREVLENGHNNLEILKLCFKRVIGDRSTADEIYKEVKTFLQDYPRLKSDEFILQNAIEIEDLDQIEKQSLASLIFKYEIVRQDNVSKSWILSFRNLKKAAFDKIINYYSNYKVSKGLNKKVGKKVAAKLITSDQNNQDYYLEKLLNLYTEQSKQRYNLIMWCYGIKNSSQELVNEIIDSFQRIGIPNGAEKRIDELKGQAENQPDGIKDAEGLYQKIISDPKGTPRDPRRDYLEYLVHTLAKSRNNKDILQELLFSYGNKEAVQRFTKLFLKIKNRGVDIVLSYYYNQGMQNSNLKDKLLDLARNVEKFKMNNSIKDFVYQNDFDLYKKLYGQSNIK